MRIVFFDHMISGGAPVSTLELLSFLKAWEGFEPHVLDLHGCNPMFADLAEQKNLPYEVLNPSGQSLLIGHSGSPVRRALKLAGMAPALFRCRQLLKKRIADIAPDVLLTNSPKALATLGSSTRGGLPTVFYVRAMFDPNSLKPWAKKLLTQRVDRFLCLSPLIAESIRRLGVDPARVRVVPNAVDLDVLDERSRQPLEHALPNRDKPVRLLLPGRIVPRKGQDCAVRALDVLVKAGMDAVLYLAGDCPTDLAGDYLRQLRGNAQAMGLAERVHELGWRSDVPRLIAESTTVILPSTDEGLPRSVMEAMALRRPCVVTPVGGVPDLIEHGQTGWIMPINDHESLAASIRSAEDPEQRGPVVEQAYRHIADQFSRRRQVDLAKAEFQGLVGRAGG